MRAILTDIEGTTTPVSFVYDVLFPYAEERLAATCARADTDAAVASAVERLRAEYGTEPTSTLPAFGNGAGYARWLMKQDRKSTGLKALQGLIWEHGYRDGTLRAAVFADVPGALAAWHRAGLRLRVYSSGSVLAQQLLFAHTEHGDLTGLFEGYHDTTTGPKQEAASYARIAGAFDLAPGEILFLSDVAAELDAAAEAGLQPALLERPGNAPVAACDHPAYRSFEEITTLLGIEG